MITPSLFDSLPSSHDSAPSVAKRDALSIVQERTKAVKSRQITKPEINLKAPKNQTTIAEITRQLPLWSETFRCLPNEIVRSALFNARNHKHARLYLNKASIAVLGGGSITYTGQELRQDDETVFLHLIHLAKTGPVDHGYIEFTPYSFCKAIGWSIKGQSYNRLRDCLTRMQATALSIYSTRLKEGVSLSMIPLFKWQDGQGEAMTHYQVNIPPELVHLFDGNHYTKIEWEQRKKLPVGLATWLHSYYASHAAPYPIKISSIMVGAGIETDRSRKSRELIKTALAALQEIGFLMTFTITGDLVEVRRNG